MYELAYRSWGGAIPLGMPKIYFTCFPGDFEKYFDAVCENIFRKHRCAVYYTLDMASPISPEQRRTDLARMNLFVIPVTLRLLTEKNRAMDEDLAYALESRIPVLPIMMEPRLDEIYSREDRFGSLHYLSPSDTAEFGLGYPEKLDRFLNSILVEDQVREEVEAAFDARMFMSYRRADRLAAMEFMRLVHGIPRFRDIAIWYDEFLIPGKDFQDALRGKISQCDLFSLVVTPKLVESLDNFVLQEEYPQALKAARPILAAEMIPTDKEALRGLEGLDRFIDPHDAAALEAGVEACLPGKALGGSLQDAFRQFLMAMAYLSGIDVEVDRERAVRLMTAAAEAGELNAQAQLRDMYGKGVAVALDYQKEVLWAQRHAESCKAELGEDREETISAQYDLAESYHHAGRYRDEMRQWEALYAQEKRLSGDDGLRALSLKANIAACCDALGDFRRAYDLSVQVSGQLRAMKEEDSSSAILVQGNVANILYDLAETDRAIQLGGEVCEKAGRLFGDRHPMTLYFLNNQACFLLESGKLEKAEQILTRVRALRTEVLGPKHPETLDTIHNLAWLEREKRNYRESFELEKQAYNLRRQVLGDEHPAVQRSMSSLMETCALVPDGYRLLEGLVAPLREAYEARRRETKGAGKETARAAHALATALVRMGQYQQAMDLLKQAYKDSKKALGEKDKITVSLLYDIGYCMLDTGSYDDALTCVTKVYDIRKAVLGEAHPLTLSTQRALATAYDRAGYSQKALETDLKVYDLCLSTLGEEHPDTLAALHNLASGYYITENWEKAVDLSRKAYETRCRVLGEAHPDTVLTMSHLSFFLRSTGQFKEALDMAERAYALQVRLLGRGNTDTLRTLSNIAHCQVALNELPSALIGSMSAFRGYSILYSPDHPLALEALQVAAMVYRRMQDVRKALELDQRVYDALKKSFQLPEHPAVIRAMMDVAWDLIDLGRGEEALKYSEEAYSLQRKAAGGKDEDAQDALLLIAMSRGLMGESEKALALFDQYCAGQARIYGESDLRALSALYNTAAFVWQHMDADTFAFARAEKAYKLGRQALGSDHRFVAQALELLKHLSRRQTQSAPQWKSVMEAIRSVKVSWHYDRLLMNPEGRQAAEEAVSAYAPGADLTGGYAVQRTSIRLLGLGRPRGILFTETALYSDQLPREGIPYDQIRTVSPEDSTVKIILFDASVFRLELGASTPAAAAALRAACDAPKG